MAEGARRPKRLGNQSRLSHTAQPNPTTDHSPHTAKDVQLRATRRHLSGKPPRPTSSILSPCSNLLTPTAPTGHRAAPNHNKPPLPRRRHGASKRPRHQLQLRHPARRLAPNPNSAVSPLRLVLGAVLGSQAARESKGR